MSGSPENYEWVKFKEMLKKKSAGVISMIIFIVLAIGSFSSFYTVEPDEEAVVIRLGKFQTTNPPGLHFKIPFGIDRVIKVKTKIVHQAEFGFRTSNSTTRRTTYSERNFDSESLMLTGDLNVAEVQWVVQFQISDPFKFIFQTSEPVTNIRDISESIMRRVVGDKLVTEVLTTGRVAIAGQAKELMQDVINKYDMGVSIKTVKLQDVNPPKTVQDSFNEVNSAKQEQEKMINQAEEAYNKVIPEARGKAKKLVSEAMGYAEAKVNRAEGDTARFLALYREYKKAPNITKKRIYLETMEDIYKSIDDITILDSNVKGLLPVFGKMQGGN
jgi:membrane protease subunit HflK